jgi:hypothetical protein
LPASFTVARPGEFLKLFAGVKRLHLTSARLGGADGTLRFPVFPKLRHLDLSGMLSEDDDTAAVDDASLGRRRCVAGRALHRPPQARCRVSGVGRRRSSTA